MKKFLKNNWFICTMLIGIILGCIIGWLWPDFGSKIEFLGTIFINMMFCVVVPMVFCSISSAIANMKSVKRAGKVLGATVITFLCTALIASVIMYVVCRIFPVVTGKYEIAEGEVGATLGVTDMIVNFFTKPDFIELFSRRAILPLVVAAIIFGFGIQMAGGPETKTAALLSDITNCIMKTVKIITYYAPIGFLGFFASLVATYGPELIGDYSRTLIIYYVLSFVYLFASSPLYARFGGGKGAAKIMFKNLFKPAAVAFGTCSSVATIPTNMEVAQETGISKEVSEIVLPMGATMHMDGSAMSAIIKVAFLFGIFGLDFGAGKAILAIIVAVFSSVAMSGVPGGGGTGELVLCTIFFPDQLAVAYPIALALGNLVDPPATMVNAAGDYVVSFIVSRFADGKDWLQKQIASK
ncbi:MAG: dicarboxylate/amino acid:cation symporter [Lachnospiraceae bacterium]|nr:dicarboxylate/amino acid:cation symporter [Lachnospiraceae bacterium]